VQNLQPPEFSQPIPVKTQSPKVPGGVTSPSSSNLNSASKTKSSDIETASIALKAILGVLEKHPEFVQKTVMESPVNNWLRADGSYKYVAEILNSTSPTKPKTQQQMQEIYSQFATPPEVSHDLGNQTDFIGQHQEKLAGPKKESQKKPTSPEAGIKAALEYPGHFLIKKYNT